MTVVFLSNLIVASSRSKNTVLRAIVVYSRALLICGNLVGHFLIVTAPLVHFSILRATDEVRSDWGKVIIRGKQVVLTACRFLTLIRRDKNRVSCPRIIILVHGEVLL